MNIENFSVKNFRVFDEFGASFPIKPISIITGCNSSGKSSIVKSIFILKPFIEQIINAYSKGYTIDVKNYKIDFTSYPNNSLGRFDKVIHKGSDSNEISIAYTVYSRQLSKEVEVSLIFFSQENDELNNAYLKDICISIEGEVFFSSSREEKGTCNLNLIKDDFFEFVELQQMYNTYSYLEQDLYIYNSDEQSITVKKIDNLKTKISQKNSHRVKDVFKYIYSINSKERGNTSNFYDSIEQIEWSKNNNSLFFIPILQHIDRINKNEISKYICDNFYKDFPKEEILASKKIIEDYYNSSFTSFTEYFKEKEKVFLENVSIKDDLFILDASNISIKNGSLFSDIFSIEAGSLKLNDDGTFSKNEDPDEKKRIDERNSERKEKAEKWCNLMTFNMIYYIVMKWNTVYTNEDNYFYKFNHLNRFDDTFGDFEHTSYLKLTVFASNIVKEALCIDQVCNLSYISSSRAEVKRLYSLENNDDFSKLLKKYFEAKKELDLQKNFFFKKYESNSFTNKWLKKFGIGDCISMDVNNDGLGVQIRIKKNTKDFSLLADEGYGITQLVSILLQIETSIMSAKKERVFTNSTIALSPESEKYKSNTIAIEEPEIHLHPKYQSLLADMIVDAYTSFNIHFIIETHSEYLVRKLQLLVATKELNSKDVSILYINSAFDENDKDIEIVKSISICDDGYLDGSFGPGFYDEAISLSRKLI